MKHRRILYELCLLLLCLCAGCILRPGEVSPKPQQPNTTPAPTGKHAVSYAKLPLSFEANQGQTDGEVKFISRGRGYGLFLTGDEAVLELQKSAVRSQESGVRTKRSAAMRPFEPPKGTRRPTTASELQTTSNGPQRARTGQGTTDNGLGTTNNGPRTREVLRLKLLNANRNAAVTGARELPGKVNYFIGNNPRQWRTNVPTYAEVRYRNVYPGIDLVYYGNQAGRLEYDFVVAPGADPSSILLAINAAEPVRSEQRAVGSGQPKIDSNGDLVVHTEGRDMAFVSASPSSLDLSPGQSGNYTWAVTASGGFNHAVDFSCSVTASNNPNGTGPPPATCTTSPAVVTPTTTPTNVTVTVTIPVSSGSVPRTLPPLQKRLPAPEVLFILSALLATAASKVQRWKQAGVSGRRKPLVLLAAGLLLTIGLAVCGGVSRGGGGSDPPVIVTTGTYYTVAVTGTATSGSTTLTNMSNIQIYVPN